MFDFMPCILQFYESVTKVPYPKKLQILRPILTDAQYEEPKETADKKLFYLAAHPIKQFITPNRNALHSKTTTAKTP